MPAFESRRVRTQPLTVTGVSFGASPERISRTLNSGLLMGRGLLRGRGLVHYPGWYDGSKAVSSEGSPACFVPLSGCNMVRWIWPRTRHGHDTAGLLDNGCGSGSRCGDGS